MEKDILFAIKQLHKSYDATLKPAYGDSVSPENVVIESGKIQ